MGKPRLPWKRGPIAWEVALRADKILEVLAQSPRGFFSLRKTARMLGVSTQPVVDWIRLGCLKREGPRGQVAKPELIRFLNWLCERAEPFDTAHYATRFARKLDKPRESFKELREARFPWPKGRAALSPRELAQLVNCHPSLIVKAIQSYHLRARPQSPCRWEVTRNAWRRFTAYGMTTFL